jgi:hypothetical protein
MKKAFYKLSRAGMNHLLEATKSYSLVKLFFLMAARLEYGQTEIVLDSPERRRLEEQMGYTGKTSLTNALRKLIDLGLITGAKSRYRINPEFLQYGIRKS